MKRVLRCHDFGFRTRSDPQGNIANIHKGRDQVMGQSTPFMVLFV